MATLHGCAETHTVMITDRGGTVPLGVLSRVQEVSWGRARDQRSTASVTVSGRYCSEQADQLAKIEPRRSEIVIYRGGERVWEGPVRHTRFGRNSVRIMAADVLEYAAYRPITKHWPGPDKGGPDQMTKRVEAILKHELGSSYKAPGTNTTIPAWEGASPKANVLPHLDIRHGPLLTRAEVLPFQMTLLEHLQNLARGGLDFTVVGRRIVVWDPATALGRTRVMTEGDFDGDPTIFADGEGLVTVQHVTGPPDDGAAPSSTLNTGSYVRDMTYYGPWSKLHTRNDEDAGSATLQAALNTQARNLSAGGVPVPTDIEITGGSRLRLDHSLTIHDLVPGTQLPVSARMSGRTLDRMLTLDSVTVTENADGETITGAIGSPKSEEF